MRYYMKKGTKEILSGVLAVSILISTPAGMNAEEPLPEQNPLNRTGSVYDLTSLRDLMERQYNTYNSLDRIEIVEMNIDAVEEFDLYVSRNGELGCKAGYTREISGSADAGYTYVYQIDKENFAAEGLYRLTLYSRDRAGNEVNNVADIHGSEITFIIDNTAPKVVIDGVESGMVYHADAQEAHIVVTDNFKLTEAEFTLVDQAGEVIESWDYMALAGENNLLDITIMQHSERMSLLYRVKDAAGNEMQTFQGDQTALADFLVTADKNVHPVDGLSHVPANNFFIIMAGAAGTAVAALAAAIVCERKRNAQ